MAGENIEALKQKREVMIGVPTMNESIGVGVVAFLHVCERKSLDPNFPFTFSINVVNGMQPVEYARNQLVGQFLRNEKAELLWFVDTDMLPGADCFRVLESDFDIVAPRMLKWDAKGAETQAGIGLCAYKYNVLGDYKFNAINAGAGDSWVEVDAVGTGGMIVSRKVLEDRRLWGATVYTGLDGQEKDQANEQGQKDWGPPVFRFLRKPNGAPLRGEDLDFCWRAKQLGYKVAVNVQVGFGHLKPVNLDEIVEVANRAGMNMLMHGISARKVKEAIKQQGNGETRPPSEVMDAYKGQMDSEARQASEAIRG